MPINLEVAGTLVHCYPSGMSAPASVRRYQYFKTTFRVIYTYVKDLFHNVDHPAICEDFKRFSLPYAGVITNAINES